MQIINMQTPDSKQVTGLHQIKQTHTQDRQTPSFLAKCLGGENLMHTSWCIYI